MMFTTPFIAFAPQVAPPGPRMTSIRSINSSGTSSDSQNTPELSRSYIVRPSISTSSLPPNRLLNPRTATAHLFELICATCMPGTRRNSSGTVVKPDRRMSSCVMT
jgi:hypothetical protein